MSSLRLLRLTPKPGGGHRGLASLSSSTAGPGSWSKLKRQNLRQKIHGGSSSSVKAAFSTTEDVDHLLKTDPRRLELRNATEEGVPVSELPSKAEIVICGGGAQGMCIAHDLAVNKGLGSDVVLIDKGRFGGGTTWHSSGLVSQLKSGAVETKLCKISIDLYKKLENEHGFYTGWKECGSLYLAQTKERFHHFRRVNSESAARGVACELIRDKERIQELSPITRTDDLEGAFWVPTDGVANPLEICLALGIIAADKGAKLVPHCCVDEVVVENGRVKGIRTNIGYIECNHFVNTAGYSARYVGTQTDPRVHIPLHPAEHYFLHTKPVPNLPPNTPVIRDLDGHVYLRENEGRFLAGGFEPVAKPAFEDGLTPDKLNRQSLQVDWDHFHILLEGILKRVPIMETAILERLTNAPEPFSPDGNWIVGKAPDIRNYYVAAAMRSIGIGAAGGVGKVISDYITEGKSPFDLYNLDIQRFLPMHNNRSFLKDRVTETPGLLYAIPYPFLEHKTGRCMRTSPIFTRLQEYGARFSQVMGYERPMYFAPEGEDDSSSKSIPMTFMGMGYDMGGGGAKSEDKEDERGFKIALSNTFFKPPWFDRVQEEFLASREAVSICDYTSFAKMYVWSANLEVVDFLQRLCSADIDIPVGTVVHSGMQNEDGGYQNDCTLARLAPNHYMLMSPSIQQMRAYSWMRHHLPQDHSVQLQDVTSLYTTLCLMGPESKNVLKKLTDSPVDGNSFPFFSVKSLNVAMAPDIITMNVTHTGELGYVFYIPNEFALHVFDSIIDAGKEFGIRQCGYYAMRALRIEKFYAFWGQDLDSASTPLECGRGFRVKMKSEIDFIGKDALQRQLDQGIKKMLVMLILDNGDHDHETDPWPWGGEPIYRDNKYVGSVTTTSFGFSLQKIVAIGFIHNFNEMPSEANPEPEKEVLDANWVKSGSYEIEIAGVKYPAAVRLNPPVLPVRVRNDGGSRYYWTCLKGA